ncbi:MAG: diguanylate cyclase [Aquamicrobium sp.]|uniref:diguanylate cyclase n=1 Tax=Mesorhizobium sp. Pch-S TaxID=2082387 RepID=UPI00101162C4|nr:diguanylate cyclase [Mesorhizobium sp. Pch-S]MBR2689634.1 diguanylate cyclase [Aquamicrobium sp.]QAZ41855.1 diguanylate cyclase [Mesorhizobium sp. Pch-S]
MRITSITNWAYGITVVLTALSGGAFMMSSHSALQERAAVEEHLALDTLAEDLALGAELGSDDARLYVMRGDERYLEAFRAGENSERSREATATKLAAQGLAPGEAEALKAVVRDAEALDKIELAAIEAFQRGDKTAAQEGLFGAGYERVQGALVQTVAHFRDLTAARTGAQLEAARDRSNWWSLVAKIMLAVTGALFVAVLYFVLRRRVVKPLMQMTGIVSRLAKQDYTVEVPVERRADEIGEMNDAIEIFRTNLIERERLDAEQRADQRTKDMILQMMHRVQACQNQAELAEVVVRFIPEIFPDLAGGLYILNDSKTALTRAGVWLEPQRSEAAFPASACWGLRRGRSHESGTKGSDVPCRHLEASGPTALCMPLTAQGDMIGLIYTEERGENALGSGGARLYLELIAENVGLAIANLQLREKLIELAVRDPLTGLFNRRFLDETLQQHGQNRSGEQIACLMVDIDHFKRFNDEFGHDAGDLVMQYVGQILRETVGPAGTAYRFGGEEFTVLLPGLEEDQAAELADGLRRKIGGATLSHSGRVLGTVSTSIGVAASPQDGSIETLVTRADAALLKAKAAGRNRTVMASEIQARQ